MANTTDSFILPSLQPSTATRNFILQVVTIDRVIVSTTTITPAFTSPTSVIPTSSSSKKYYCNN